MGLQNRIVKFIQAFRRFVDDKTAEYQTGKVLIHDEACILVDAFMGDGWDGDQQYACYIAADLKERGYDTHVYAKDSLVQQNDKTEALIDRFPYNPDRYWDTLFPILKDMEQRLPFVLLANSLEYVMAAAYILKKKYPDKIRIISVIHNDNYSLYEKQTQWQDALDAILGISEKIADTLKTTWRIPAEKVLYKLNPVFLNWDEEKDCSDTECNVKNGADHIRIGWGGRLTTTQKNTHLLPKLIQSLEQRHLDYSIEVAGTGSYAALKAFIEEKGLEGKVHLLGLLEHQAMADFWRCQQVYINLSGWEGCCLAMLEAMYCGTVPVVTDVSGTADIVYNGQTGFRVSTDETEKMIEEIADKIVFLAENPDKRERMPREAAKIVRQECGMNQYFDYMETLIQTHISKVLI